MAVDTPGSENVVLTFDQFWIWIQRHSNCILRASTPEVVVFDDEELHWHFDRGEGGLVYVQVIRGKRLMGEIAIRATDIDLVQGEPAEEGEFAFDLFLQGGESEPPAYTFIVSHGYEEEAPSPSAGGGRWMH